MRNAGGVIGKLTRHWQLFGFKEFVEGTDDHCAFLYHRMCDERPNMATVSPHLFTSNLTETYVTPWVHLAATSVQWLISINWSSFSIIIVQSHLILAIE